MPEESNRKAMRLILGISISKVMEEDIKNSNVREWFGNAEKIEDVWRRRKLLLVGRIARLHRSVHPLQMLTITKVGNRRRAMPFHTIRDDFVDNIKTIIPTLDYRGNA